MKPKILILFLFVIVAKNSIYCQKDTLKFKRILNYVDLYLNYSDKKRGATFFVGIEKFYKVTYFDTNSTQIVITSNDSLYFNDIYKYVLKYNEVANPWIRSALSELYYSMYIYLAHNNQQPKLRQELLYNYFYLYGLSSRFVGSCFDIRIKKDFNDKTIQRINEILNYQIREDEIQCLRLLCKENTLSDITVYIPDTTNIPEGAREDQIEKYLDYNRKLFKEIEITGLTIEQWRDSVYKAKYEATKKYCETRSFEPVIRYELIQMIGFAKLDTFIPQLEVLYLNDKSLKPYIEYAFAQMNYKDFGSKKLEKLKTEVFMSGQINYNTINEIVNLKSQDGFAFLGELLNCDKKYTASCFWTENVYEVYFGWYIFDLLMRRIKNFPFKLKHPEMNCIDENGMFSMDNEYFYYNDLCNYPQIYGLDALQKAYDWMQKNKGKYIF